VLIHERLDLSIRTAPAAGRPPPSLELVLDAHPPLKIAMCFARSFTSASVQPEYGGWKYR
jgi:hypothetical protein